MARRRIVSNNMTHLALVLLSLVAVAYVALAAAYLAVMLVSVIAGLVSVIGGSLDRVAARPRRRPRTADPRVLARFLGRQPYKTPHAPLL
jgi:hypothetical protein